MDHASLELTEICLSLPPECWEVYNHLLTRVLHLDPKATGRDRDTSSNKATLPNSAALCGPMGAIFIQWPMDYQPHPSRPDRLERRASALAQVHRVALVPGFLPYLFKAERCLEVLGLILESYK